MAFVYRKTTKTRGRNGKTKRVKRGGYRAVYVDAKGRQHDEVLKLPNGQRVYDRAVAEEQVRRIKKRVEREAAGIIDPMVKAAATPIRVVLARYVRHLRRKRVGRRHIRQVVACIKAMMESGHMERLADFNVTNIDKALGTVADKSRAARTINVYRQCCFSLAEWAVKNELLDRNPAAVIDRRNEAADTRKVRRSLTVDQAYRLLGVGGPRRLYYAVALWTGLRVKETLALQWGDIDFDGDRPGIRLRATATKSKRADELPLHPDLARSLQEAKPPFAKPTDRVCSSRSQPCGRSKAAGITVTASVSTSVVTWTGRESPLRMTGAALLTGTPFAPRSYRGWACSASIRVHRSLWLAMHPRG